MKEPRDYDDNVHFHLRQIYWFLYALSVEKEDLVIEGRKPLTVMVRDTVPKSKESEEKEEEMRSRLRLPNYISLDDVLNSCKKLYSMFNMPLDENVIKFIEDPFCPGGKPRCV
jgi:hypothetical protein